MSGGIFVFEIAALLTSASRRPNSSRMRLRRGGDRSLIRHVELERMGVRPDLLGRSLAARKIARPDQHSEALRCEILRDLKSDPLVGPGDQGDGFILHSHLQWNIAALANAA